MKLKNERLEVRFIPPEQNHNQRFDHTAAVGQVTLDGKYTFCTREQLRPGRRTTFGQGLSGEFVLEGAAEEAKAGEWFSKPGVGLLKQQEDHAPYDMWKSYEQRPFPVTVEKIGDTLIFRQRSEASGGYGVDIEKAWQLRENRLSLDISVTNAGEKRILLREYQHNFLCLDGLPVGEGYVLELDYDCELASIENATLRQGDEALLPSAVQVRDGAVYWTRDLEERILYHRSVNVASAANARWKLRHLHNSLSVSEEVDFRPDRIDVWAVEHCVCPELYHSVGLEPGENTCWRRIWIFTAE